jgi:hypothetical protein
MRYRSVANVDNGIVTNFYEHKILWPKHRFNAIEGFKNQNKLKLLRA